MPLSTPFSVVYANNTYTFTISGVGDVDFPALNAAFVADAADDHFTILVAGYEATRLTGTYMTSPAGATGAVDALARITALNTELTVSEIRAEELIAAGTLTAARVVLNAPASPQSGLDLVTKTYVDEIAESAVTWKAAVVAVADGNQVLSGLPTIDDVSPTAGQRVLLTAQTAPAENGIYTVAAGAWSRASDADGSPASEMRVGVAVASTGGTLYEYTVWYLLSFAGVVDVDAQTWGPMNITLAGAGLTKTGPTLSVDTTAAFDWTGNHTFANSITVDGDPLTNEASVILLDSGGFEVGRITGDGDTQELTITAPGTIRITGGRLNVGNMTLTSSELYESGTNGPATLAINDVGYDGGTTQPRVLEIYDGMATRLLRVENDGGAAEVTVGSNGMASSSLTVSAAAGGTSTINFAGGSTVAALEYNDTSGRLTLRAGPTDAVVITSAGVVGIGGHPSPTYPLDIQVDGSGNALRLRYDGTHNATLTADGAGVLRMASTHTSGRIVLCGYNSLYMQRRDSATATDYQRYQMDASSALTGFTGLQVLNSTSVQTGKVIAAIGIGKDTGTNNGFNIEYYHFGTNSTNNELRYTPFGGSPALTFSAQGTVGIPGTFTAAVGLAVGTTSQSNTQMHIRTSATGTGAIYFDDSGGTNRGGMRYNHSVDRLEMLSNGSVGMTINSSVNVGIGTTNAARRLEVNDAAGQCLRLQYTGTGYADFDVTSGGQLRVAPSSASSFFSGRFEVYGTTPTLRVSYTENSVYTDLTTSSGGVLTITPTGNSTVVTGQLRTTTPAGLYADAGSYTSGSNLLSTPAAYGGTFTERVDAASLFSVNTPGNGLIRYTGTATRYFKVDAVVSLSSSGAASTLTVVIQKDTGGNGTYATIGANEMDRYLSASNDTGSMCFSTVGSFATNDTLRFLLSSDSDTPTYTFHHTMVTLEAFL